MPPRIRDWVGAGILVVALIGLVALLFYLTWRSAA